MDLPTVTVAQMREVDRIMVEELGIGLAMMMENAGRALALQTRRMLGGDVLGRRVTVLAGPGGNGGGGLVAARRLHVWGAQVTVVLGQARKRLSGVPLRQLRILDRLGVAVRTFTLAGAHLDADVVVDALIGYGLVGAPREPVAALIREANAAGVRMVALDIPSGLNADTGEPAEPTVRADATLTLALPKTGLLQAQARAWVGELHLADISVPEAVYRRLGLCPGPVFARADIVDL